MYILSGDPKEVAKVLQENRIRIDRGVIKFTPCQPEQAYNPDVVATLREGLEKTEADLHKQVEIHMNLAELTGEIVNVVVESGQTLPEDIVTRLETFGIIVPEIENTAEKLPEIEDNKNMALEDMKEVNLDDVKDAPECDTKEAPATTGKKSRAKKNE